MPTPYQIAAGRYTTPEEMEDAARRIEASVEMSRRFTTEGQTQYQLLRAARVLRDNAAVLRAQPGSPAQG